jgi:uncharacterized protein (TIGR02217 family)
LHGFRWRDHADYKSCPPEATTSPLDQPIGVGDGTTDSFQLVKTYGSSFAPWSRTITRPVAGTVTIAVAGVLKAGSAYSVDLATGLVTFVPSHIPESGNVVTTGFMFDVPVRFDTDKLEINLSGFRHGAIPNIPIVEVRP